MPLRVLLIEPSERYCSLLQHHVGARWSDAIVSTISDPMPHGLPERVSTRDYDIVLLGHDFIADGESLSTLHALSEHNDVPPVIVIAEGGNERLAVLAMKCGAADYLPKGQLKHDELIDAMIQATVGADLPDSSTRAARTENAQRQIDGYEIIHSIAMTTHAAIYLARSKALDRVVALKVLERAREWPGRGRGHVTRFEHVYEIVSRLPHRSIADIYEYGRSGRFGYVAMEYFRCGDLKQRLRTPTPDALCVDYLRQIALALQACHDHGILHLDVKPANVMLREDGTLVLIDFGMAVRLQSGVDPAAGGEIRGTPYYMNPEQAQGLPVDERSDLYSLGIIFYEMLTGRRPYVGTTPMEVLDKQVKAPPPTLPQEFRAHQSILDALLCKDPAGRYNTAADLLESLPAPTSLASVG